MSSRKNGSANCSTTSAYPTACQPWLTRRTYQGASSVVLPDQMIRNCEKLVYAQNITVANISVPRSAKRFGRAKWWKGSCFLSSESIAIANASVLMPCPTMITTLYIVENHSGWTDMAQSKPANVIVMK
jgi:hypothetical protein